MNGSASRTDVKEVRAEQLLLENRRLKISEIYPTASELYVATVHNTVANGRARFLPRRHFWTSYQHGMSASVQSEIALKKIIFCGKNCATVNPLMHCHLFLWPGKPYLLDVVRTAPLLDVEPWPPGVRLVSLLTDSHDRKLGVSL